MYPYHNRLKQLLNTQPYFVEQEYGKFAYRFVFPKQMKSYPIRPERVPEYQKYLNGEEKTDG